MVDSMYLHIKKMEKDAITSFKQICLNEAVNSNVYLVLIGEKTGTDIDRQWFAETEEGGILIEIPRNRIGLQNKWKEYITKNKPIDIELLTKEESWEKQKIVELE